MTEWIKGNQIEKRANGDMGGTMRLGAYLAICGVAPRCTTSTART